MMVPAATAPVTAPRRPFLSDVPADQLRERIILALSLLGHRADDSDVLMDLLRDVLNGRPLYALAAEQGARG